MISAIYSVVLPEKDQTLAASRSVPCAKHDPSAGRLVGWLMVVVIRIVASRKNLADSRNECCHAASPGVKRKSPELAL
jgi:hypothetical protein